MSVRADLAAHAEAIRRQEMRRSRTLRGNPRAMAAADTLTARLVDQLLSPVFAYLDSNDAPQDAARRVSRAFHLDTAVEAWRGLDRATRLLVLQVADDILNALELWQSLGDSDARWVQRIWSRRVSLLIAIPLPATADAAAMHSALLEWQLILAECLP